MEMASSFDRIHSAFAELRDQWRQEAGKRNLSLHRRLLMAPVQVLFMPKLDFKSFDSLFCTIKSNDEDWMLLSVFLDSSLKWSDADQVVMQNLRRESLAAKINVAGDEIADDLSNACRNKYLSKKPLELLSLLHNWERRTDLFKVEIREALDFLSGWSFQVRSPLHDYSHWTKFVDSVIQNMPTLIPNVHQYTLCQQVDGFHEELELIHEHLNSVRRLSSSYFRNDKVFDDFFRHISSVVVRIALESCNYWFNKMDSNVAQGKVIRLRELQHEIYPTNPEFLELHLKFLLALHKFSPMPSGAQFLLVDAFLSYLLTWMWKHDLDNELKSLLEFFFNNKLEDHREDVQSLLAEINAVLSEVASLYEPVRRTGQRHTIHCFELRTRICLLRAEVFLKQQIDIRTFSNSGKLKIKELNEIQESMMKFSEDLPREKVGYGRDGFALVNEVAKEVASLYQSFRAMKITKHEVRNSVLLLLFKIVLFKAKSFLMELLDSNAILSANGKEIVESLLEELTIFTPIVTNQQVKNSQEVEMISTKIEVVARRISFFSYSYVANKITDEMIKEMMLSFSDLLETIKLFKAALREICPFPRSNHPKTYELGYISFLLGNLEELLDYNPDSIAPVKCHIKEIQSHLKSFNSFLMKSLDSGTEHQEWKDLGSRVINAAYKVEYVLDSIEVDAHWHHFLWFYDLMEEVKLINMQISRIDDVSYDVIVHNFTKFSGQMTSQASAPDIEEIVVDLNEEKEVIIDRLKRGSSQLNLVPIVGMPGIGKTTLAKQVYNNANIIYHFHRRAWCTVSPMPDKRELLLQILSGTHGLTDEINKMTDEDLESKLRRSLLKNRYLIVMDDVWEIGVWNDLETSFPDDMNGSRILMTSCLRDVVVRAKPNTDPHSLRLFSDEESWKLLQKRIFREEGCPEELLVIGKQIAQHCAGLPLAVVAIAGVLQRTEKRQDWWKRIAESLSSQILNDPETQCRKALELSYKHLPDPLKACFLYFGAFLGDKDIPVSKLIRLWIAEGFLPKIELKNVEKVAEGILKDLIDRSLVLISKKRSDGTAKACRIHDLLHDLCQSKAKEDKFLQVVTKNDEPYASFCGSDFGDELYSFSSLNSVKFESHRMSILLKRRLFVDSKPSGPCTRSLIFFALTDRYPRCPHNISFICHNFKLLKVLDLECINMGTSFPAEIILLIQLRYLAVSGDIDSVPRSIENLWKLETLVVKGLRGEVILPDTIWFLARLRHLHGNPYVAFNLLADKLGYTFQLDNLVSLSSPFLPYGKDTEKIIRRMPNLLKLRCIFLESWNSSKNWNQFPRLDFLSQLESLKITYIGRVLNQSELNLPLSLKKLTLSNFRLPWSHISVIGRLEHLEVLKLLSGAFEGQKWDMREEEFQELKFLKLHNLNIAQWNASSDHLPKLQRLVIQHCEDLELPSEFSYITTLQVIEVQQCGKPTEDSAREIGEGSEEIKVLISHLGSYSRSSP